MQTPADSTVGSATPFPSATNLQGNILRADSLSSTVSRRVGGPMVPAPEAPRSSMSGRAAKNPTYAPHLQQSHAVRPPAAAGKQHLQPSQHSLPAPASTKPGGPTLLCSRNMPTSGTPNDMGRHAELSTQSTGSPFAQVQQSKGAGKYEGHGAQAQQAGRGLSAGSSTKSAAYTPTPTTAVAQSAADSHKMVMQLPGNLPPPQQIPSAVKHGAGRQATGSGSWGGAVTPLMPAQAAAATSPPPGLSARAPPGLSVGAAQNSWADVCKVHSKQAVPRADLIQVCWLTCCLAPSGCPNLHCTLTVKTQPGG